MSSLKRKNSRVIPGRHGLPPRRMDVGKLLSLVVRVAFLIMFQPIIGKQGKASVEIIPPAPIGLTGISKGFTIFS